MSTESMTTPKQRVLKRYPQAYAYAYSGHQPWVIYSGPVKVFRGKPVRIHSESLNVCDRTPQQAWAAAAGRIR